MPLATGFTILAIHSIGLRLLWMTISLNFCITPFFDFWLTNIPRIAFIVPLWLYPPGRIVKPRKSKLFGYRFWANPLRLTILVFCSCNCSLQVLNLCLICFNINNACLSVLQWTTTSSAYLSKGFSGWFFSIHLSNTTCRNKLASKGLMMFTSYFQLTYRHLSVVLILKCSGRSLVYLISVSFSSKWTVITIPFHTNKTVFIMALAPVASSSQMQPQSASFASRFATGWGHILSSTPARLSWLCRRPCYLFRPVCSE